MTQDIVEILQTQDIVEPETVRQLDPSITEPEFNKLMAGLVLAKKRDFWENSFAFEDIVLAMNNIVPDFTRLQGALPEQIWYSLELASKSFPDREFSLEVKLYCKFMNNQLGVFIYHPYLGLDNPYYDKAVALALHGPWPLGETIEEIQAGKLLGILEYIKQQTQEK
jgi:hypothetical protein